MQRRLGTSIWTYGGYVTMPPFSDGGADVMSADEAASSMKNPRNWVFQGPANSLTSVRSSPASESMNDLMRRGLGNLPQPFAFYQNCYPQIGLERNFWNNGYYWQSEFNQNMQSYLHSQHAHLQLGSNFNYQQQQQSIRHQPSSLYGLSGLQNGAGNTQTMINQRICLQQNQLSSINAFHESFQKTNDASSCTQFLKTDPSWPTVLKQLQFDKPNAMKDSQGPTKPGTIDSPITVPEDSSTDWLGSVNQKIQKCKEECLHDVLKIHRYFVSKMPQNMAEIAAKNVLQIENMIKLLNLKRSNMEHKVDNRVYKAIADIYVFTRRIRDKYPMLFAGPDEESKSDSGEQQTVPFTISHQKQDTLQQEAVAVSEAENNVVPPLQPAETGTNSQPIDGSVSVNQSKNIDQEAVSQTSPVKRLIKAVKEASPEALMCAASDMFAAIIAADRIHEIPAPAYENGGIYKRFKRNFNAMAVQNFYDTDGRICLGSDMLDGSQSLPNAKRQKVEENKKLMDEIEFLSRNVFETQVVIEKTYAGWPILESSGNFTVSCTFTAACFKALEIFSHLFPARMQLSIPRDYPESQPTIVFCRHQNCGQMCASLQEKYETWSQSCDMTSVTEIVKAWNACARELYVDICLGPGKGRERLGNPCNWIDVSM